MALIALGIYAHVALDKTLVVSSASASSTPLAILVLGIVIFFISFFGCCGAWKESYCMVTTVSALTPHHHHPDPPPLNPPHPDPLPAPPQFAVLLSIIFLVEIAAAIAGYVFKDKVGTGGEGARTRLGAVRPSPSSPLSSPPPPPGPPGPLGAGGRAVGRHAQVRGGRVLDGDGGQAPEGCE